MGLLKKITRPLSKFLDKVVPNEIKPALPYLAAFAPFMMGPQSGIMGSSMWRRALASGALNLGSQLAQEGSEGEFDPLSLILASSTGAMTSPDAPGFFKGMQRGPTGTDQFGNISVPYSPDTGIMSSIKHGIGKGGETAAKFLAEQGNILRPGGEELTLKNALTAGALPVSHGTGDLAMADARRALRDYEAQMAADESQSLIDDDGRRMAIRAAMEAAGHIEDDILDALSSLGLRSGGIVSLNQGGRVNYQTGGIGENTNYSGTSNPLASYKRQGYKPYDSRATTQDFTKALQSVSAGSTYQQQADAKNYARQQASSMLDQAMKSADPNKGPGLQGIYEQFFKNKNTGIGPNVFNPGASGRMMSYSSQDRGRILDTMANQMLDTTNYSQPKVNERREKEYADYMNNLIASTYGKADDYKAEAMTLGMPTSAYFDYLTSSDPQDKVYTYDTLSRDPYFDPKTYVPTDYSNPETPRPPSPYEVYFQKELQNQTSSGIPEGQRIQQGQVLGLPTLAGPGSQMGLGYESYEDALARTKQQMGLREGGRVGLLGGGNPDDYPEQEAVTPWQLQQEEGVPIGPMVNDSLQKRLLEDFQRYKSKGGKLPLKQFAVMWMRENAADGGRIGFDNGGDPKDRFLSGMISEWEGIMGEADKFYTDAETGPLVQKGEFPEPETLLKLKKRYEDLENKASDIEGRYEDHEEFLVDDESKPIANKYYIDKVKKFDKEEIRLDEREKKLNEIYNNLDVSGITRSPDFQNWFKLYEAGDPKAEEHPYHDVFEDILFQSGYSKRMRDLKTERDSKAQGGVISVLPKGKEADYRGGGVIPVGSRERADDVPARLSKNEFVMTADAVRAAGGGSINKGAKRMYNLMHNLEARV